MIAFLVAYWWVPLLALVLFLGVMILLTLPFQALRRGQGFTAWFLLQIVAFNPVYPMIVLALLPNKRRSRMRVQFAAELDEKLKGTRARKSETRTMEIERSLGDLPTVEPVQRSIGDIETHG